MSELLKKHQQSCDAAEALLTRDSLFAAAVHCSYYSCVQLMSHILRHHVPDLTPTQFAAGTKAHGSHDFLRQELTKALTAKGGGATATNEFDSYVKQLKATRVKADYSEFAITEDDGRWVQKKATVISSLLKSTFSISE